MGDSVSKFMDKGFVDTRTEEQKKAGREVIRKTMEKIKENPNDKLLAYPIMGIKESQVVKKAPMAKLFKQFPLALQEVGFRTLYGHEKYKDTDEDWMNWKRVPNAISEYEDASARHSLNLGEEETELGHLAAKIWNDLAVLQLKLEQQQND